MLAQHQPRIRHSHRLRRHDFVGQRILQDSILVNAGLVGKSIAPDDCLIGLHWHARDLAQHLAGRENLFADHAGLVGEAIRPNSHGHHNFFQGCIPRPLSNSIDRALDLSRSRGHRRQRIGYGHSQIVVAVCGNDHVVNPLHPLPDGRDQLSELRRYGVANRVRNVQRGSSRFDDGIEHATQKIRVGTRSVFRRELYVIAKRLGEANRVPRLLHTLIARDPQLILQMNIRSRQKHMDPRTRRSLQCLPGALDVGTAGASQSRDNRTPHHPGNRLHRFKVAVGGDRKTSLDHIHTQAVELMSQPQLFLPVHAATR